MMGFNVVDYHVKLPYKGMQGELTVVLPLKSVYIS